MDVGNATYQYELINGAQVLPNLNRETQMGEIANFEGASLPVGPGKATSNGSCSASSSPTASGAARVRRVHLADLKYAGALVVLM